MKFVGILLLVLSLTLAEKSPLYTEPGEVTADNYGLIGRFLRNFDLNVDQKIANGVEAKKGETPEFCYLSITFVTKQVTCGCFIVHSEYVATSARCVVDCSEKRATNITVTFPAATGKDAVRTISTFWVPDGMNGGMALAAFSETTEIPYTTIGASNVALIKLSSPVAVTDASPLRTGVVGEDADMAAWATRMQTGGYKFKACGLGVIDDKGNRPKGVMCTEMNIVDATKCAETFDATKTYTIPAGTVCLQWPDRTNNACVGDWGGPVYAFKVDAAGAAIQASQEVFCTMIGSPNQRSGSPCLDAHITVCTFLPGPYKTGVMNPRNWAYHIVLGPPPMMTV